jgi:hypothetical protein
MKNAAAQEAEQVPKAALHDTNAGGAVAARTVPNTAPAAEQHATARVEHLP